MLVETFLHGPRGECPVGHGVFRSFREPRLNERERMRNARLASGAASCRDGYALTVMEQGLRPELSRGLQSLPAIAIQTAFHFYLTLHTSCVVPVFSFLWFLSQTCLLWALWSRAEWAVSSVVRGKWDCPWAGVAALLGWSFLFEFQFRSLVNSRLLPWNGARVCSGLVGQLCIVCSACSPARASQMCYSDPLSSPS